MHEHTHIHASDVCLVICIALQIVFLAQKLVGAISWPWPSIFIPLAIILVMIWRPFFND